MSRTVWRYVIIYTVNFGEVYSATCGLTRIALTKICKPYISDHVRATYYNMHILKYMYLLGKIVCEFNFFFRFFCKVVGDPGAPRRVNLSTSLLRGCVVTQLRSRDVEEAHTKTKLYIYIYTDNVFLITIP